MGQNGRLNYAVDLENHAAVLVGRWVVKDAALAGVTSFTVRDRWVKALVPTVGASDAANFQAARIVFRTGKNNGYSTTVTSVVSASGTTTVSIKDAIPNALAAGDGFTIYRSLLQQSIAPSSYNGTVGSGSTTTQVVDSVGGFVADQWKNWGIQFTPDTTTVALRGKWQQITSNTSDTLTLAAALPTAPVAGDTYDIRPFGSTVLDLTSWADQAVAAPAGDDVDAVPAVSSGLPKLLARLTAYGANGWDRVKQTALGWLGVSLNEVNGTAQTGADWTPLLQGAATKQGALTDGSGTITAGGTPQQVFAANASRRYLLIQNPASAATQGIATAESLFLNFGANATEGEPAIELTPGDIYTMEDGFIDTETISVIAATTGHKFTAKEG